MIGYAAAGAVAGGIGHVVQLSNAAPWLAYAVPVLTVLALLMLARRVLITRQTLTQIRPRTEPTRSPLFARLARLVPRDPTAIGALTALLPCAALGAALLLAATTQSRSAGAALMLGFATTSALGVIGGGIMLARATQLGSRFAPRALAVLLTCAALYVGLRPIYRQLRVDGADAATAAPSCH